jgi:hypothetical protein
MFQEAIGAIIRRNRQRSKIKIKDWQENTPATNID